MYPPSAPQNLTAQTSGSNVILKWEPNPETDLAGYNVYKNTDQGWIKINTASITGTTYTEENLPNGTYTYRISAMDMIGNEGETSNEASAAINIELPQPPLNLIVTSITEGSSLKISWEYNDVAAGYNLYSANISGGPYTKVNSSLLNATYYDDTGLTNGIAYYYVVTAVDSSGNESLYSNEAMGIPNDTVSPSKPVIFFPTTPTLPITLYGDRTDISGSAEPGLNVEIFVNNVSQGIIRTSEQDESNKVSLDNYYYNNGLDISPDGSKVVFYDSSSYIKIKNLDTGTVTDTGQMGYYPKWSPDSKKVLYYYSGKLYIYDSENGSVSSLTSDSYYAYRGVWSPDGRQIAFYTNRSGSYEIWIKNIVTGELRQVTSTGYAVYPEWSPDGKHIAYTGSSGNIYFIDIESGASIFIDSVGWDYTYKWSPDAGKIVYAKNNSLWIMEIGTQTKTQFTPQGSSSEYKPVWSPDGEKILFGYYDSTKNKYSIALRDVSDGEKTTLTPDGIGNYPYYLLWSKSGRIAYTETNAVNLIDLEGQFHLDDVQLNSGENTITAVSIDEGGNQSPGSEGISVTFDASLIPDVEVTTDDIVIYPSYPMPGQDAAINITISNKGQVEVNNVDVDVYMLDSSGSLTLLETEQISSIAPGLAEIIGINWSSGNAGTNTLIVSIDPEDKIHEFDETNNYVTKDVVVVGDEEIIMTTSLDAESYHADQDVNININLKNPGMEKDVTVSTTIEDEGGAIVTSFDSQTVHLNYGADHDIYLNWNTGSTYASTYNGCSLLKSK
ncbi:MAG: DPP IV N-terminal domain-containing protein [Nitrospirae bacterium]|nr:DPP IV N-terminal domain-containing protein [Nitrospirota bacterium]